MGEIWEREVPAADADEEEPLTDLRDAVVGRVHDLPAARVAVVSGLLQNKVEGLPMNLVGEASHVLEDERLRAKQTESVQVTVERLRPEIVLYPTRLLLPIEAGLRVRRARRAADQDVHRFVDRPRARLER